MMEVLTPSQIEEIIEIPEYLAEELFDYPLIMVGNSLEDAVSTIGGGTTGYEAIENATSQLNMTEYINDMLHEVATMFMTEPFNYLFGAFVLLVVILLFKKLTK